MRNNHQALPIGQRERQDFPRFGIGISPNFVAPITDDYSLQIAGNFEPITLTKKDLSQLPRVDTISDFHCVTTWSYRNIHWSGFRLKDVYEILIKPQIPTDMAIKKFMFRGLDKYKSSLLVEDALADDILLVDMMDNEPLSSKHGAPLRIIAPAHYGYKNVKHLRKIDCLEDVASTRSLLPRMMDHERARVEYEERGRFIPGWILRYLYRPLIASGIRRMNKSDS